MRLRKPSLAFATIVSALGVSALDSASVRFYRGGNFSYLGFDYYSVNRAPQPGQRLPGAMSRPSNRDMRGMRRSRLQGA
jgi:hypothetical protein